MRHRRLGFLPALCAALLLLPACAGRDAGPLTETQFKLDTAVTVKLYEKKEQALLDGCMERVDAYADIFDAKREDSELGRLNAVLAQGGSMEVSDDLAAVLTAALRYCALSDGAFDVTVAPVSALWDFKAETPAVPDAAALAAAAARVDWRMLAVEGNTVSALREGVAVDLGAVAKGYIADRLAEYLRGEGAGRALIDLGGNLLCVGADFDIGVQKPFGARGETIFTLSVTDGSVVCSGVYERYFELDGVRYHHLLDTATGYPLQNGLTAICVRSASSMDGDALSTVLFSLGGEEGLALAQSLEGIEAAFIYEDGAVRATDNFYEEDLT